ncbi:UbiD family decarboxylase [Colletotrichum truncatum]|uniref:UbiD family decarboxylase n=1 Tax=Colletotrichum truncatum TaxID=5467 RepID=A0ACC3Z5C3_COLTU|nr:UbiD family decarboxylase [Colletotrichum truncatum]KAF6795176.1 UbiD family decarboxylase [Colletotrichum truncatum]
MSISTPMVVECWLWYGLAVSAVVIRFISQYLVRKRNFIKEIPVDDFLMLLIAVIYTTAISSLFKYFDIAAHVDFENVTPHNNFVTGRRLGILNILAETSIQTTLWGNKCCILLLYFRLALFGHHRTLWIVVSAYIGLAYVTVMVALYGGWCRPFSDYLVLQPGNMECLTWRHYNILQMTLNLSTDLLLLAIPVTLISRLKMKIGKKILLVCLFSLGIFVMLAAIFMKLSVFLDSDSPVWFLWSVREVSTAMIVGNLSLCMPIARTWWRFFFPGSSNTTGNKSSASSAARTTKKSTSAGSSEGDCGESYKLSSPTSRTHDDIEIMGKTEVRSSHQRLSLDEEDV